MAKQRGKASARRRLRPPGPASSRSAAKMASDGRGGLGRGQGGHRRGLRGAPGGVVAPRVSLGGVEGGGGCLKMVWGGPKGGGVALKNILGTARGWGHLPKHLRDILKVVASP